MDSLLLLVDYSSILYRAYHSTPASVPMHGVHGCLNMLARIVSDRKPAYLGIATDDDWRPAFRVEAIPSYKTHRVSEEPDPVGPHEQLGREVLQAFGIAVVGSPGYEAEDVIATLAAGTAHRVEILSGDRDLFALVRDPQVTVLFPVRGTSVLAAIDEAEIEKRYGIPGRAYGDYALLRGDPSDGLPGVPGVGEKTAARLIQQFGSLQALLDNPAASPRVAAAREYLQAAQRVVLPRADIPLPPNVELRLPSTPADEALLEELTSAHRLQGPVSRLRAAIASLSA